MIAIPFIYFSILLIFILKRKKAFEISAYLVSLYLISSFFAILIDVFQLRSYDTMYYDITMLPTFLYCFLLTLLIWPFYKLNLEKIVGIRLKNKRAFDLIVYLFFISFLVIITISFKAINQILNSDILELRLSMNRGESIIDLSLGWFQPIYTLANIFGGYSILMLLFYFYSKCFLNNSRLFNSVILLASTTTILIGILGVDRSRTVYWLITYGLMLVLFWRFMSTNQRKAIFRTSLIVLSIIMSYVLFVTFSRFGEADIGTEGGLISYAGQAFINFSFFYDNVHLNEFTLQKVFPWYYHMFVDNDINGPIELNAYISWKTGISVGVFSTLIGDIMMSSGKVVLVIYCFVVYLLARMILNFRNKYYLDFYQLIFVFCLITIPMLGLFNNYYANHSMTMAFSFFMIYAYYLKYN